MAVEPAFDLRLAAKRPAACVNFPDAGTVSLHAIQLNTFTWNEAVTKLKYLST